MSSDNKYKQININFTRYKWNRFGRYAFYFNLIYYVAFVGVFTEYMQVIAVEVTQLTILLS